MDRLQAVTIKIHLRHHPQNSSGMCAQLTKRPRAKSQSRNFRYGSRSSGRSWSERLNATDFPARQTQAEAWAGSYIADTASHANLFWIRGRKVALSLS